MGEFKELTKEHRQMLIGTLVNHINGENKPELGHIVMSHSKLILSMIFKQADMIKRIEALEDEIEKLKTNE